MGKSTFIKIFASFKNGKLQIAGSTLFPIIDLALFNLNLPNENFTIIFKTL